MVAVASPRTARPAKRAYKPQIETVDRGRGLYTVSSETYTYVLYAVDVIARTCECTANATWGKECKHLRLADAKRAEPVARPSWHTCPTCGAQFWGTPEGEGWCISCALPPVVEPIDLAARRERPAFTPAIAEFAELFG